MALDLHQSFVSAQYLENKWTDFYQHLYNYLNWQDRPRLGLLAGFRKFVTELWPLIDVRITFPLNILRICMQSAAVGL